MARPSPPSFNIVDAPYLDDGGSASSFTADFLMIATISLDLKGLKCPAPTLKAKRQLKLMAGGEILHVVCSDPLSSLDIPFLAHELGHALVGKAEDVNTFEFWIQVASMGRDDRGVWPAEADE